LYRFPSQEAAESWLEQQRAARPNLRTDIEVREIEPARQPVGDIDLFPELNPTQQDNWSQDFERRMQNPAPVEPRTEFGAGTADAAQGGIVDVSGEQPAQGSFTGEWKVVDANGQELYRFSGVGNSQSDANRVAAQWAQRNMVRDEVNVIPVMS
jgi:hypothetical protein